MGSEGSDCSALRIIYLLPVVVSAITAFSNSSAQYVLYAILQTDQLGIYQINFTYLI